MKLFWFGLIVCMVVFVASLLYLISKPLPEIESVSGTTNSLGNVLSRPDQAEDGDRTRPLRIGLVPERDVFAQHKRYQVLGDYLGERLGCRVQLRTSISYQAVLADLEDGSIDAAFLGSLVAALAIDRYGAKPIARPVLANNVSTYRGVLFVPTDSPITSVQGLAGRTVAGVQATTAGCLFPLAMIRQAGIGIGTGREPQFRWVGTHDDVLLEVLSGRVEAGAAKDLRLDALLAARESDDSPIRILAVSDKMPNNALLVSASMDSAVSNRLFETLTTMSEFERGATVLSSFGAVRFIPCSESEYRPVYDFVGQIGTDWVLTGIPGPAPRRSAVRG
ncbi:MAG: phosphate/phosphite/phosphonate ABC transporter substrate-binding protein [Planctomycetes bacterium]|nr:phosphate/phosphite/phosphonate ABC transporter substrate-binding protein [Planctomycetota bacterium]NOG53752.1 phosphate/phosphite/phosphonate ABC transporter substrate-binding protein [Planctomycetota bacterium]